MKLSVLGAAGATGIPLVEQALAAGHRVTALVRSGQKLTITNPNLHVVEGDATDRAAVSEAMNGGDAVPVVATDGNQWRIRSARKRQKQAKSVAVGCHQLPLAAHGKEGVSPVRVRKRASDNDAAEVGSAVCDAD
jgi:putative NADH-flavin reductase